MTPTPRLLILASTSPYRRALLDRLQLTYEAAAPPYDEPHVPGLSPRALVELHARRKAETLRARYPSAVIIGSDQGLGLDDALIGKPHTPEGARAQLRSLAGRTVELLTAVAVLDAAADRLDVQTEVHRLTYRALSEPEIARYVDLDRPLDCAGTFKIESLGVALFARIEGEDPTAIMGLPLMRTLAMLRAVGVDPLAPGG